MQVLELQDIGSRQPSMESLTGPTDTAHLHPGQQFSNRRSPSLRYLIVQDINIEIISKILSKRKNLFIYEESEPFQRHQFNFVFSFFLRSIYRRAGSPLARTPSPRRRNHLHPHHDVGFSDTVSNVVEIVKEERGHRSYRPTGRYPRGTKFISN